MALPVQPQNNHGRKSPDHQDFVASPTLWGWLALLCCCCSALLASRWEERLVLARKGVLARGASYGEQRQVKAGEVKKSRAGQGLYQKLDEHNGQFSAEYGFINFNNDPLSVSYTISSKELAAYRVAYGYTDADIEGLKQWQKKGLDDAYQHVVKNRLKQDDLNRLGEVVKAEYRKKYLELFLSRGFAMLPGNVLVADIPAVVRRNVRNLRPVAIMLSSAAEKLGYDSDAIISASLSLVQTALLYENVPMMVNGRHSGGIYPPLDALVRGKGDCDTKTALLAAILLNWDKIKLVGVGVPNHYLMGVLRNPAKGEAFVEYKGLRYVLFEPAGPAWLPPGSIGPSTTALLNSGKGINIEQFTAN
jgi:hypothetical protein